jgi:hypothetical protein
MLHLILLMKLTGTRTDDPAFTFGEFLGVSSINSEGACMMTTGPTPVEAAKRVVMILVTVQAQFLTDAWTLVDFQTGLSYAAERRWIEMRDREAMLTDKGFAKV